MTRMGEKETVRREFEKAARTQGMGLLPEGGRVMMQSQGLSLSLRQADSLSTFIRRAFLGGSPDGCRALAHLTELSLLLAFVSSAPAHLPRLGKPVKPARASLVKVSPSLRYRLKETVGLSSHHAPSISLLGKATPLSECVGASRYLVLLCQPTSTGRQRLEVQPAPTVMPSCPPAACRVSVSVLGLLGF